jgi:hypothetical protein
VEHFHGKGGRHSPDLRFGSAKPFSGSPGGSNVTPSSASAGLIDGVCHRRAISIDGCSSCEADQRKSDLSDEHACAI